MKLFSLAISLLSEQDLSDFNRLDPNQKAARIIRNPEILDQINIDSLYRLPYNDSAPAYKIIMARPELIDKFEFMLIPITSEELRDLVIKHPQFIDRIYLNRLKNNDILKIITEHPDLIDKFPNIKINDTKAIASILIKKPELINKVNPKILDNSSKSLILQTQPRLIKYINVETLDSYHISAILSKQPQLIKKFNIEKLDSPRIAEILKFQPQLAEYFDLSKLKGHDVADVISTHPQLIYKIDVSNLDGQYIRWIYKFQPQLIDKLPIDNMDGTQIAFALSDYPELIHKLEPYLYKLDGYRLESLLSHQPSLADYFDLSKLKILRSDDIFRLLHQQKSLIPKVLDIIDIDVDYMERLIKDIEHFEWQKQKYAEEQKYLINKLKEVEDQE